MQKVEFVKLFFIPLRTFWQNGFPLGINNLNVKQLLLFAALKPGREQNTNFYHQHG